MSIISEIMKIINERETQKQNKRKIICHNTIAAAFEVAKLQYIHIGTYKTVLQFC